MKNKKTNKQKIELLENAADPRETFMPDERREEILSQVKSLIDRSANKEVSLRAVMDEIKQDPEEGPVRPDPWYFANPSDLRLTRKFFRDNGFELTARRESTGSYEITRHYVTYAATQQKEEQKYAK